MDNIELKNLYELAKKIQKSALTKDFDSILDYSNELAGELQYLIKNVSPEAQSHSSGLNTRVRIKNKEAVTRVAYFVSRFEHDDLFPGLPQKYAFEKIANALSVKPQSFRNVRDIFDKHIEAKKIDESPDLPRRKGWDSKLKGLELEIFEECGKKNKEELLKEVKEILDI